MKPCFALRASLCAAGLAIFAASSLAQQTPGARSLAATCFTCHGTDGHSAGGVPPSLAGRPKNELIEQMREFKSGARASTVMQQQAKGYTDQQIELIAGYFASVAPAAAR
jgi:cytochrome subunit of sulfide dehydrogenase